MLESLGVVLPIIIYILLIFLLIPVIILFFKLIITVDTINKILYDVRDKIESINGVFRLANTIAEKLNYVGNKVIDGVINTFSKVFSFGSGKDDEDYE